MDRISEMPLKPMRQTVYQQNPEINIKSQEEGWVNFEIQQIFIVCLLYSRAGVVHSKHIQEPGKKVLI